MKPIRGIFGYTFLHIRINNIYYDLVKCMHQICIKNILKIIN